MEATISQEEEKRRAIEIMSRLINQVSKDTTTLLHWEFKPELVPTGETVNGYQCYEVKNHVFTLKFKDNKEDPPCQSAEGA